MKEREGNGDRERDHSEEGEDEGTGERGRGGTDALEEGRWGVRERCGSSKDCGEGFQRERGRNRRKGDELTASERVGYG